MVAADVREISLPGPTEAGGRGWRRAGVCETNTGLGGRSGTTEHDHAQQGSGDTGQDSVIRHLLLLPLSDLGVAGPGAEAAEKARGRPECKDSEAASCLSGQPTGRERRLLLHHETPQQIMINLFAHLD